MPVEALRTADPGEGAAAGPAPGVGPVVEIRRAAIGDPLVEPLLRELTHEYVTRYGPEAREEMSRYPAEVFAEPAGGLLLLLLEDGAPVAGGAYKRYDERTAELKRMWTHSAHRRRGLAGRVLAELEREAAAAGYSRIYLTTGPLQPEAKGLYLAHGYTPLFDVDADPLAPRAEGEDGPPGGHRPLPFEKHLPGGAPGARTS
ncbi:GNAT family N-acetyltransferase [Kitasatospora sp. A2-31]|uniref:GNAT family N-acetyltransferase n=1 Tax=Kitasatospora sp. A2-31 TaxID=2916414 RepID=UPI001EECE0EF|nr:GNAT family N-acetyltransferase [Kitasatospora sp. A2-31]MCG6498662.1 GNAT family N-acetyltransferase [Kitasatospora sp. A2-31]